MGFPKALLPYRQETFLDTLIGLFAERCAPVIVVLGAAAELIEAHAKRTATFITNPDYLRGMTTSLQCGLRAVSEDAAGVLFTLVDHPAVSEPTLDALLAGAAGTDAPLVRVPRYHAERGHPVWFSRRLIPELLAIPEGGAANQVVRRHAAETEFIDVDDPGILADIDDPEAYRRLRGAGA